MISPFAAGQSRWPDENRLRSQMRPRSRQAATRLSAGEVPPPGDGLTMVTVAMPAVAMSLAGMAAVSCALLTKVVVRPAPFHHTLDVLTNPLPLIVSVNAAPPAVAAFGLKLAMAGAGLLIVKVRPFEVPPPGAALTTVTVAVPALAKSVRGLTQNQNMQIHLTLIAIVMS